MRSISLKAELETVFVVTLAYITLFAMTFLFVMPTQGEYFHWLPMNISLLFLPHGVRLLSIYLFGWKALFYLLPGHIITWAYQSFMLDSEQDILLCHCLNHRKFFRRLSGVSLVDASQREPAALSLATDPDCWRTSVNWQRLGARLHLWRPA